MLGFLLGGDVDIVAQVGFWVKHGDSTGPLPLADCRRASRHHNRPCVENTPLASTVVQGELRARGGSCDPNADHPSSPRRKGTGGLIHRDPTHTHRMGMEAKSFGDRVSAYIVQNEFAMLAVTVGFPS